MNFKLVIISSLILSSCSTVALEEKNAFDLDSLDENRKFELFLSDDWEKYLSNNPLFATYTGDKRQNNKINPNTVDHFFQELESDKTSLAGLYEIDFNKLNDENKLNYKLKEFSLNESINSKKFPTYYLRLNQRGGIQSFYETGNRLVYSSSQDYFDWLERLEEFTNHINISLKINKEGLSKGITQPKMITKGVIEQIDAIIDSDIDTNPYMKVFLEADESILTKSEKKDLIDNAKNLIENKINPAYVELNKFLKNDYIVNSRNSIGIKDVPGGSEYYEDLAKHFTTTNLTPDEIHEIGLTEIKRIRLEMEAIIDQVNWDGDFNSFLNYLRTSPKILL
jgi:prolyl oligopeptidase